MNNSGEKTGYRVILLLVVGLTAFSSAMKELNQVQQLSLDGSRLIAQWTEKMVPSEVPQTAATEPAVVKVESCPIEQSAPSIELPWLKTEPSAVAPARPVTRTKPLGVQIAKLNKLRRLNIDPIQFEVRIAPDHDAEADELIPSEFPITMFKAKTRKQSTFRINTRDREMLLKTLNRHINLRAAG